MSAANAGDPDRSHRTLVAMIRAAFPHDSVPAGAYERTARVVQRQADDTTWLRIKLAQGLESLDSLTGGRFADLSPADALPVLLRVQQTPFFGFVRQTAVVNLYEDEEVWEALGYEGPSFDRGGYLHRGFDDLDWLPEPRIDEYDGEALPDVVSDLPTDAATTPAGTDRRQAANTRPAAVPVGQTKAAGGRTSTGKDPA